MVFAGETVRGASLFAPPTTLAGKRYKPPAMRIPTTGQTFMLAIRGFEAASRAFKAKAEKDLMERVHKKLLKVAEKILSRSQQTCPVGETLKLASSGRIEDRTQTYLGIAQEVDIHVIYGGGTMGVEYAVYVHEGHTAPDGSWVKGNPWLVRAARSYRRLLYKETKDALRQGWANIAKQINLSKYRGYGKIGPGMPAAGFGPIVGRGL